MINRTFQPYEIEHDNKLALPPKGQKYFRFAARETCLARDETWISWLVNQGLGGFIKIPNQNIYDYYLEEKSAHKTFAQIAKHIESAWRSHINSYQRRKQRLLKTSSDLGKVAATKNDRKILAAYVNYIQSSYDFSEYVMGAWGVIFNIEPIIVEKLADQMEIINALERPIEYFAMEKALLENPLLLVRKRYGWLKVYSPADDVYTISELKKIKLGLSHKNILEQQKKFKITKNNFKKLVSSINDKKLKLQAEIVHTYAFLKTDRVDAWRQAMFNLRPFYSHLAKLSGVTLVEATNLSIVETLALLKKAKPDLKNLQLRSSHQGAYFFTRNRIRVIVGGQRTKNILNKLEGPLKAVNKITGISAAGGKAKGRVKIITHSSHLKKVKRGDIFVAKYTFPNFTPAMVKSAAIITDEGGLTSHAAIVSREFGIPCIVGTKIGTRVLKDGDRVEIDADKGEVRKL